MHPDILRAIIDEYERDLRAAATKARRIRRLRRR